LNVQACATRLTSAVENGSQLSPEHEFTFGFVFKLECEHEPFGEKSAGL
jgi:hypothetical protein